MTGRPGTRANERLAPLPLERGTQGATRRSSARWALAASALLSAAGAAKAAPPKASASASAPTRGWDDRPRAGGNAEVVMSDSLQLGGTGGPGKLAGPKPRRSVVAATSPRYRMGIIPSGQTLRMQGKNRLLEIYVYLLKLSGSVEGGTIGREQALFRVLPGERCGHPLAPDPPHPLTLRRVVEQPR